jgi:rRNA maturation endonuclease Nob1
MKCPNCGNIIDNNTEFCKVCGSKITAAPPLSQISQTPEPVSETSSPLPQNNNLVYILLGGISAVLTVLLSITIFFFVVVLNIDERSYEIEYTEETTVSSSFTRVTETEETEISTETVNTETEETESVTEAVYTETEEAESFTEAFYTETTVDLSALAPELRGFVGKWYSESAGFGYHVMQIDDYLLMYSYDSLSDLQEGNENVSMFGYVVILDTGDIQISFFSYVTDEYIGYTYISYDAVFDTFTDEVDNMIFYRVDDLPVS